MYDREFLGSFSIKSIAPVLVGKTLDYSLLDVGDGMVARSIAENIMNGKITDKKELQALTESLLIYCRQDTIAMVELFKWLLKNT